VKLKAFRNGSIRFLQIGRITVTFCRAKAPQAKPAPRASRDPVTRIRASLEAQDCASAWSRGFAVLALLAFTLGAAGALAMGG
jgi:hypothetical protein